MIQVTRKEQEASENVLRRFNRKMQQAGTLARAKSLQYFEKAISKSDRRKRAIIRKARKADKLKRMRFGER